MTAYDDARVEGHKTIGDAYRDCERDPEAFLAGAHYALDKLLSHVGTVGVFEPHLERWLDETAADLLERAKRREPQ